MYTTGISNSVFNAWAVAIPSMSPFRRMSMRARSNGVDRAQRSASTPDCSDRYHRDLKLGFQRLGRGDSIHVAFQADVHEGQIERSGPGATERFHSGLRNGRNGVAEAYQLLLDVGGDQAFVFYDQDVFSQTFV